MSKSPPSIFRAYLSQLNNASKAYKWLMLLLLLANFVFNTLVFLTVMGVSKESVSVFVAKAFLDSLLFVAICHCLMRPYLRLNMLTTSVRRQQVLRLFLYLLVVSIIYMALSFALNKLPFLSGADIERVFIQTAQGDLKDTSILSAIAIAGTVQSFIVLSAWSVCYLVVKYQQNKRLLQDEVNASQLRQLTHQLNPHFLFNTLNSVRALVYIDQDKAGEMITQLSELLRQQMQSNPKPKVALCDEWELTQRYLAIESVRFDDRLQVFTVFADNTLQQMLPSLCLLTFTENAIKHGIAPSGQRGEIYFRSEKTSATQWRLQVSNTCYTSDRARGTELGLANIRHRLALMFGDSASLYTEKTDTHYTVTMELPYA